MSTKHQQLPLLLNALTTALRASNLWQIEQPSTSALASRQPFCIDTLSFAQWLQFIFIEKMQEMLKKNLALPTQISLCPMAEEAFKEKGNTAAELINVIADIDELLSGKREQHLYVR
ncbi:YqcC family protein [Thalassotalea sp. ND16A]|uniref:YqcC family protein n=1 Tax=Thalassotalea sp. ND16A TaxID=1535422 RepID=UPI00051A58F4|nr:YqcC family protein [Thalassotalea sp. ND16A]KGJ95743.1 hypothetical protein ND16A_1278 [Thalassotalea sp. ND16A]